MVALLGCENINKWHETLKTKEKRIRICKKELICLRDYILGGNTAIYLDTEQCL